MGFLDRFKKKENTEEAHLVIEAKPGEVYAPVSGEYIPLEQIPDDVFAQGIVGPGCGIQPSEGKVVASADGEVCMIADTKHAIAIRTREGAELMIHIGLDTVSMGGKGFEVKVREGQKVSCGTTLMLFDMDAIREGGYPLTSAFIVTNGAEYPEIHFETGKYHSAAEKVGFLSMTAG